MNRRMKLLIVAGTVAVAAVVPTAAFAVGGIGGDDAESAITGPDLARATDAALAYVGSGTVAETEMDKGTYEVEVLLNDGTEVEVHLDASFTVIGSDQESAEQDPRDQDGSEPDD